MKQLNRKNTNRPKELPLKVMQFGGGNFLRAFVDYMVDVLNDKTEFSGGIAIIKPTERGNYSELKAQDGLFHVLLDGIKDGKLVSEKRLVTSVQEVVNPYSEWQAYLNLAKEEDFRFIISNTTEAGIKFNPEDNFNDTPPKEFPAKLTLWLYHRFQHFEGSPAKGCILLPCELVEKNGEALRETILQYTEHWQLGDDFKNWIATANHFCSTLVDRIVSGYPSDLADVIQAELGYADKLLVSGEQYHSWVIQGPKIVQKELPFSKTDLNVQFVDDLAPYREMKVRILNGAHTAMVPVGYLMGIRLVKEAMEDEGICNFIQSLLLEETIKTLDFSERVKEKFVQDVLDRFRNPSLEHRLISISLNSISKFVSRLLPTLKDYQKDQGALPRRIVFAFAAMIRFYKGDWDGEKIEVKDDEFVMEFFQSAWREYGANDIGLPQMVQRILEHPMVWGEDLTKIKGLSKIVSKYLVDIETKGIRPTLKSFGGEV